MFTIHLVSPTKSFKQNSVVVVPARGKASSNLLPSQRLRLLPEVSKSTKRSGSSRLGRSLQTQISPWKWLSFQCDCRHLAALAPNHLAGPEGWAHSLDTDEIVDRNFARMCMVRWVKLVFQTNELTEEKQLTCPRSRCCVTERWDWYKLKLDPAKSRVRLSSTGVSPRCPELAHETQLWSASNGLDSGWTMLCRMSGMSVMLMDMFLRFLYSERGLTRSDHFATASISWKHQKKHNNVLFHVSPVTFLECMAGLLSCSLVSHIPTLRDVVAPIRARDLVLTLSSLILYPLRLLKVIKIPWVLTSRQRPKLFQIETCQRKQLKQIRSQNQKCCSVSWKKL